MHVIISYSIIHILKLGDFILREIVGGARKRVGVINYYSEVYTKDNNKHKKWDIHTILCLHNIQTTTRPGGVRHAAAATQQIINS